MERGKSGSGRGGKNKAPQHPVDLFALGAKASRGDMPDTKRPGHSKPGNSHATLPGTERKRELPSSSSGGLPVKKAKVESSSSHLPSSRGDNSPSTAADSWELVAIDCEPSDFVASISRATDSDDLSRAKGLICGAIKLLRTQRAKPDKVLYLGLMYIATVMPNLYTSDHVVQALCSLLRRDPTLSFKSKGNPTVPALAANLLFKGFQDYKHWPEIFIKVYVEDSIGERVWVDMDETRGFVDNVVTAFSTRPANRSLLPADFLLGPNARSDSPTVSSSATNTDDEGEGEGGQAGGATSSKVKMEAAPTMPRYRDSLETVEAVVMEAVREQLSRRQPPESVSRNLLRLLASACGLTEVRLAASPRLELWLQNPKLMRATQELLLSVCANCVSHTTRDTEVIGHLVKMRLKTKAVVNLYLSGIKELIAAHTENLSLVLKLTIYNELSTARNPNNMAVLAVMFQAVPEQAASTLADVFQELLMNRDDYLRPLRALLRELVRVLRGDLPLQVLCRALMRDRRDQTFRDFSPKERMMAAIADLVSLCILLAVSPAVREAAALLSRGDKREIQTLLNFRTLVAKIQRDAVWWLQDTVPRMFHPVAADFNHALHKVLFLEPAEVYHGKDSWPSENERATMYRLASEVHVLQNTLARLCLMGTSKEHPISCPDLLDLIDRIIKRAAAIPSEGTPSILVEKTDLFELLIGLCTYRHPENITLPQGYCPPQLAITNLYWKAWIMLLILAAHNPSSFGNIAWEKYPILRALMEMCITNHFIFPPPTMALLEEDNKEIQLAALEKQQILEFESHLAAASTKVAITETTSLLLSQLTSLDPTGPARAPTLATLEALKKLNEQLHLGHRLCRSRRPDFLLDVIQRQGASQAMPWLADLVESSEGALSHLPVQCLCEFLLSDSTLEGSVEGGEGSQAVQQRQVKQAQLLTHLRGLLSDTASPDAPAQCCEVLEYFLRRLGSPQAASRSQAIKGLKLLLTDDEEDEAGAAPTWLLQQLPLLPHFSLARPQAVLALRQACQAENELSALGAYLQFLAKHAVNDPLPELADLVLDMAQLIVERNTIAQSLLPSTEGETSDPAATTTLHALMQIFMAYLQKAREPRKEAYTWSESQDQILVTWSTGEESTMHILVVHAMIILLTYGPGQDAVLFSNLMETWVPTNREPPKAFLVDTSEEALLIPDWLKLRMIQSSAPGLIDAALTDLEPPQLLLFVQSFGIPPANMSKLLLTLDRAVESDPDGVREAVQDKTYMAQLVQVQHYRGAVGGQRFLQLVQEPSPPSSVSSTPTPTSATLVRPPLPTAPLVTRLDVTPEQVPWLLGAVFSGNPSEAGVAFSRLHRALSAEVRDFNSTAGSPLNLLITTILNLENQVVGSAAMAQMVLTMSHFSCPLFRLVTSIKRSKCPANLQKSLLILSEQIVAINQPSPLTAITKTYISKYNGEKTNVIKDDFSILQEGQIGLMLEPNQAKKLVETATQKLLDQAASTSTSTTTNTGLLLDWLSCLEPEMIGSCPEKQMQLLFSKAKGGAAACRPYLLTLLTHRTSWATLHTCMTALLKECNKSYDSAAVLDFLWALIGNPKLWQGREKRTPKHHSTEDILGLSTNQISVLLDYVVEEALCLGQGDSSGPNVPLASMSRQREVLETRVPLVLQCVQPDAMQSAVRHLAPAMMARDGTRSRISRQLLLQLYLCVPGLISHLADPERDAFLSGASATSRSSCTLDVTSHCLLSALAAAPGQGKDWNRKAQDLELTARKMAATHPLLVLRQLPMLASSLRGRVHLESPVFRGRSHLLLFMQSLGLLELLQPHLFQPEHAAPLEDTLDSFFAMFQLHMHLKDVQTALARTVTLLQSFVSHDAQRALKYLQRHCQLLHDLQAQHPGLPGLQSLLAGLSLPARDGDEPELLVAAALGNPGDQQQCGVFAQNQVAQILAKLSRHAQGGEDIQSVLQDLDHVSLRRPALLEACVDTLSPLLLSPAGGVRSLAHVMMLRYLRHSPTSAGASVSAYLRCLDSQNPDIQASALERLPEVIVCAQEYALLLLERLFKMGVRSGVHTAPNISRAVALLQLQSGC